VVVVAAEDLGEGVPQWAGFIIDLGRTIRGLRLGTGGDDGYITCLSRL
jgi:hypothetical protein